MSLLTPEQLLAEASHWEAYAQKLREAAALYSGASSRRVGIHAETARHGGEMKAAAAFPNSRPEQLKKFIERFGPATYSEMRDHSGIPEGSVKGVLRRDN